MYYICTLLQQRFLNKYPRKQILANKTISADLRASTSMQLPIIKRFHLMHNLYIPYWPY